MKFQYKKIGELCNIQRGSSPRPKGDPRFFGGNVPRLTIRDVTRDGKYVTPCLDFLTEEGAKFGRLTKKGNLTMSISGTVGSLSFLNVDASVHDGFVIFSNISSEYNKYFLYYYLKSYDYNSLILDGGIFKNLTTDIIKEIEIPIITIDEQLKIVNKLENQEKKIETVKKLLEKIEIRNQYYADKLLSGELSIENNIVIPNKNNQNNRKIKIIEHIDIINGYPFKSNEMKNEGKYTVIKMSNFKEKKVSTLKNTVYTNNFISKVQLLDKDLLIGLSGSVGEYAIFDLNEICLLNQRCIILRNKNDDIGDYVKIYIINKILEDLKNSGEGGVIKNVSSNFFQDIEIILPLKYKDIILFINKINEEKEKVEKLLKLEEQRFEWLSDKLLSGEYIIED